MINEKAEGFRTVVRACKDRLRRAWALNLPPSEIVDLQKKLHEAMVGLRRMGLKEERKPGTLLEPRKSRKKAEPKEEANVASGEPASDESPSGT
jgi:hypothetical protein